MNAESNETLPVSEKYMLTIKEAAAYFNIGIKKLRKELQRTTLEQWRCTVETDS